MLAQFDFRLFEMILFCWNKANASLEVESKVFESTGEVTTGVVLLSGLGLRWILSERMVLLLSMVLGPQH